MLGPPRVPEVVWPLQPCPPPPCDLSSNAVLGIKRQRPGWAPNQVPLRPLKPARFNPCENDFHCAFAHFRRPRWGFPMMRSDSYYAPINGLSDRPAPYPSSAYYSPEVQWVERPCGGDVGRIIGAPFVTPGKPLHLSGLNDVATALNSASGGQDFEKFVDYLSKNSGAVIVGMIIGAYISGGK